MDEQVGDEEEEVGTAETGQQMVEDVPHRPKNIACQFLETTKSSE